MAQLWGGRFTKETDKLVYNFNASISFDQKFYKQDIKGSMAHVKMLAKQGILTEDERDQILAGLEGILADVESGKLEITSEYEDIHSFVEANLIDRINMRFTLFLCLCEGKPKGNSFDGGIRPLAI